MVRKVIGWFVAQAYRATLARYRALRQLERMDGILPIVFHAAEAHEVREILRWLRGNGVLDRCELTFDDGWRQFCGVMSVLEEFNKEATLFIAPGETRRGRVWTDGTTVSERQALYGMSEADRVRQLAKWGICTEGRLMTEEEVRRVARHPLVRIGNHTWSHLSCTSRPFSEVIDEVRRAQEVLTEWSGKAPTEFAYPFGRGTAELDETIGAMGLRVHYTRQGFVRKETIGKARNMVYEGMSLQENLGRILMAWPKVGETL